MTITLDPRVTDDDLKVFDKHGKLIPEPVFMSTVTVGPFQVILP